MDAFWSCIEWCGYFRREWGSVIRDAVMVGLAIGVAVPIFLLAVRVLMNW